RPRLCDRAREHARHRALGPERDAAHRQVEASRGEVAHQLRPAEGDELEAAPAVVREAARDLDVEPLEPTVAREREGRVVAARADPGPPRHPEGGAQCPAREAVAALRAVDELEALAEAAEDDRVVADGVAGAQAHDPDLIARPLAHQALAREPPGALEVLAARPRHRAPERE